MNSQLFRGPNKIIMTLDDLVFINPELHKKVSPPACESNLVGCSKTGLLDGISIPTKFWEGQSLPHASFSPACQKTSRMLSAFESWIRSTHHVRAVRWCKIVPFVVPILTARAYSLFLGLDGIVHVCIAKLSYPLK